MIEETEKFMLASLSLKEKEVIAAKVEASLAELQNKQRRDAREEELLQQKKQLQEKVESLERRLESEREAWFSIVKKQISQDIPPAPNFLSADSPLFDEMRACWSQTRAFLEKNLEDRDKEIARLRSELEQKEEQKKHLQAALVEDLKARIPREKVVQPNPAGNLKDQEQINTEWMESFLNKELEKISALTVEGLAKRLDEKPASIHREKIEEELRKQISAEYEEREQALQKEMEKKLSDLKETLDHLQTEKEYFTNEADRLKREKEGLRREAEELLQAAERYYQQELKKEKAAMEQKRENVGLFTRIGRFLDTPVFKISGRKTKDTKQP